MNCFRKFIVTFITKRINLVKDLILEMHTDEDNGGKTQDTRVLADALLRHNGLLFPKVVLATNVTKLKLVNITTFTYLVDKYYSGNKVIESKRE